MTESPARPTPGSSGPDAGRSRIQRRRIGLTAAVVLGVLAFTWAIWPKPVGVDITTATVGPMAVTIDEEGKTRIKDVFLISTPQTGKMLRSPLLAGDEVVKGKTLVAEMQPARPPFLDIRSRLEATAQAEAAEAAVKLAEAELAQAQSELKFAEAELKRARSLATTSTVSERTLERSEIDKSVRSAAVTRAEANLAVRQREAESARARLVDPDDERMGSVVDGCCVEVRSPVSGRVLRVHHTSEQVLPAGTPLVEVGDPQKIEIVVELVSADAVRVRDGASVAIEDWGGEKLEGKVRRVEAAGFTKVSALGIEEQRVRVIIDLVPESLARHRLGHEYRVFARIRVWEADKVLRVPIGALFRHRGEWVTFRVERGRARRVQLTLGQRNGQHAQILGGLAAGDVVILHPGDRVADGVRVNARTENGG
ncbi:MAG: HlyD family efflux transporter periplasmic adaptor subunit [Hyphomicrobiaceae bacterium]|nr:HlyD family efflux transporter periplasmic adaptor subunit [Hyphomicrobiaceae bacterium]